MAARNVPSPLSLRSKKKPMGGCVSVSPEEKEARDRNAVIERELRAAKNEYENTIKILLLGKYIYICI